MRTLPLQIIYKISTCIVCLWAELPAAKAVELRSPDGNMAVHFELKNVDDLKDCPVYGVSFKGRQVLVDSGLGLDLRGGRMNSNFEITGQKTSTSDTTWTPVAAERQTIRDDYNQLVVDLQETRPPQRRLQITFRAYDEGVAFCYTLPEQPGLKNFEITRERTQFSFAGDYTAWAVYQAQASYDPNDPRRTGKLPVCGPALLSQIQPGAERPLTVRIADDLYASITEARLVDYARMKLRPMMQSGVLSPAQEVHPAADSIYTLETFLDAENNLNGEVVGQTPFISPWRVVMVASSPGKLVEQNYLILNLNDPCALMDTSWIKPGKVIRSGLSTAASKACIDFAVQQRLQYIEYDAGWYGNEYDPKSDARAVNLDPARNPEKNSLDLKEVIAYGNTKGIGVILYVNHLAMEKQLDAILPLYEEWGVKGVKYGFVNVGSQHWTAWLHEAVRKAAAHKLMVDIHDEFRSTGYQRTYPNLMTVEGVGGNETFPTPVHNATLPFTRFLTGPADYTYCWNSGWPKVTRAHQLAISTIFFSPWQFLFWYDSPATVQEVSGLDYWKNLPTTWDETLVLQGEIGHRAVVARRKGDDWFIGAISPDGGKVPIAMAFLPAGKKFTAKRYRDTTDGKRVQVDELSVDSSTILDADLLTNGGEAIEVVPMSP